MNGNAPSQSTNRSPFGGQKITDAFYEPGTRNYLFLGLAALLMIFVIMFASDAAILGVMIAALGTAGLILRFVIAPPIVMLLSGWYMIDPSMMSLAGFGLRWQRYERSIWDNALQPMDLVLGVALMIYLIAQYRVYGLTGPSIPAGRRQRIGGESRSSQAIRRPPEHVADNEFPMMFALAVGCIIVGQILALILWNAGIDDRSWRPRRPDRWIRFVWLVWVLGLGGLILSTIFAYIGRRNATPTEARRFLEDIVWQDSRREQSRIHRWRIWQRRRSGEKG